ncbi:Hsp20 family protein [Gordonia humi]|uniref:HSP20 family protein n=1 Tax=Gordonia humi TaxID=686429 RepID=A0A840F2F9_9ACTN|nr:HSP20 family protein [Gordonia humi]
MLRFDPFSQLDALTSSYLEGERRRGPAFMPMDLCKVDDHYLLTADLPGVDPGSIDLDVDRGVLTVSAQRSVRSAESVQWMTTERFSGSLRRQIALGDGVDAGKISASYDNGVLSVTIPLAEAAKPRKISVEHDSQPRELTAAE